MTRYGVVIIVFCSVILFAGAIPVEKHGADVPQQDLDLLSEILDTVTDFQDGVYNFWINYGPDEEYGAFYTTVDQFGVPDPEVPKNIIMQTRQLYAASAMLLLGIYPQEDQDKIIQLMHGLYDWIEEHLAAPHNGEFYYSVSPDGETVVNGEQRMYYTVSAIWGLAHYSMAARQLGEVERADRSLKLTMDAFQSMYDRLHDSEYGGYIQSREANWFFEYGAGTRGQYVWGEGCKGYNSHLHVLEALMGLYQASNDAFIRDMLIEMQTIYMNILYKDRPFQPLVMYCNWTSFSDIDINFGHDIETAHIMQDAGYALNYANVSKEEIDRKVLEIVDNVILYAFDRVNGGVFMSGIWQLGVTDYTKAFWVQVESALGFWRAYLISGNRDYLEKMQATLIWYRDFHLSPIGEFYWENNLNLPDPRGPDLYEVWKAAYHNMRCLLTIMDEIEDYLG
eukprot:TRINITY_DN110_c1_g1_i1.p1 TRINITY_DN110_c1_g1~~TRINITY_DN110_c1_g1_i1.p1  ORF type:complete len:451 (-),score=42.49 TRINITY_DN110_c1_g1_i1:607-1959(-)